MEHETIRYRRLFILFGVVCVGCLILIIQLIRIQLIHHLSFTEASVKQRQKIYFNQKVQGSFYDRNLRLLRGLVTARYLMVIPGEYPSGLTKKVLKIMSPDFQRAFMKKKGKDLWIYHRELSQAQQDAICRLRSPYFQVVEGLTTRQSTGNLAWHILGMNRSNANLSGLEASFKSFLHHRYSVQTVFSVVDGLQSPIPGLGLRLRSSVARHGVVLTLDARYQQVIENIMDREKVNGAVVMLDVKNGQILAMASRPVVQLDRIADSLGSSEKPFLNRAIAAYYPGSVFKLVILCAGLDSGFITGQEEYDDPGYFQAGERKWPCTTSKGGGHGRISLTDALAYSCNPVFIQLVIDMKPERVLDYAEKLGMGLPANIGLQNESYGHLPSGIGLTLGEQANLALGQQCISTTPLQIASMIQTIANDGLRIKPTLVQGVIDNDGSVHVFEKPQAERVLSEETARKIQQMMAAVTRYGTGTEAQISEGAAGKTGTAQVGNDQRLPDHAWFAGFAPLKNPRYAVVVFCEKGGFGGKTAAPLFKEIMENVNKIAD